jgi:hypothetical protein
MENLMENEMKNEYIDLLMNDEIKHAREAAMLIQHAQLSGGSVVLLAPAIASMCGVKNGTDLIFAIQLIFGNNSSTFTPSESDMEQAMDFDCVLLQM